MKAHAGRADWVARSQVIEAGEHVRNPEIKNELKPLPTNLNYQGKQMIHVVANKPRFKGMAAAMTEVEINRVRKALVIEIQTNPAPIRNTSGKDSTARLVKLMGMVWPDTPGFNKHVEFDDVQ